MPGILIRNFRNSDLEGAARLVHLAFADPDLQEGGTPESVVARLSSLRRAHIRILAQLLRYKLEMIVAEVEASLAGFVMITGRGQINLNTLMVDPQYRRCGIGAALLEESFHRVHSWGYRFATSEVLVNNLPSAKLCQKLGFEVYDTSTIYETPLPLSKSAEHMPSNGITLRPVQDGDQATFTAIERSLASEVESTVRGSAARIYFPSLYRQLVDMREHKQSQAWAVEKDEQRVGFQYLHSSLGNPKSALTRPMLQDTYLNFLPSIVEMAGDWSSKLGKSTLRLEVPDKRPHLMDNLSTWTWQPSVGWLWLVKWLDI
jgi:ribosomal protein S18 acetylase RimI-like enzyme